MATSQRLRFLPPLGVWLALAVPLGAVVFFQLADGMGDQGINNAGTYVAAVLAAAVYGAWFLWRGGASRLVLLGLVALLAALVFGTVRIGGWTGNSVPELHFVWAPPARPVLDGTSTAPAAAAIDLSVRAASDFAGFLGTDRSGIVHGVRLARDWSAAPPARLWRIDVGTGWSGFAIVNGVAVTQEQRGDQQLVVARDAASGSELWRRAHAAFFDHSLGGPGPRATPTIAGGRIFVQDTRGLVQCLAGATGEVVWQRDLFADYGMSDPLEAELVGFGRSGSPLVLRDLVIVPGGGDPAGRRAGLVALDRETGAVRWEGPPRNISHASPTAATLVGVEQVLVVNEDTVSGHDPGDGRLLWEHPWDGRTSANASNSQPVAVPPDRVLVSKGYGQGSALLRLTRAADGAITCASVWASQRALRTKFTNVVIRGEHVYALSDGILECVALATGERVWRDGRYGHGQVLLVEDLLLVLGEEGELTLVEATPERENHVLGQIQALEGKTWNTMALVGDVLFVRNGAEAAAWRLPLAP